MKTTNLNELNDWLADLKKLVICAWSDIEEREDRIRLCMIFQLFLNRFSANIANKSFIIMYGLDVVCDFWSEETDDRDEVSEDENEQVIDAFIIIIE